MPKCHICWTMTHYWRYLGFYFQIICMGDSKVVMNQSSEYLRFYFAFRYISSRWSVSLEIGISRAIPIQGAQNQVFDQGLSSVGAIGNWRCLPRCGRCLGTDTKRQTLLASYLQHVAISRIRSPLGRGNCATIEG